jgi:rRNA-processing protein FCF1
LYSKVYILDADALIKLNHAGVLDRLVEAYSCLIPDAVYAEVVTVGKAHGYPDASEIEGALEGKVEVRVPRARLEQEPGMGAGESAALELALASEGAIVVSDDPTFLARLARGNVSHVAVAFVVVSLRKEGVLSAYEANEALERLRPAIRRDVYREALDDLELR